MAYASNESGTYEVYVRPFSGGPSGSGKWQISTGGGGAPVWSRDGRELLFETQDDRIMSVSYTAKDESFLAGKAKLWTPTPLRDMGASFSTYNYDLAPDGKRLAALMGESDGDRTPISHLTFLLNFFDELQRRVPAGK